MSENDLLEQVRALRAEGCAPKQLAGVLGVSSAEAVFDLRAYVRAYFLPYEVPPVVAPIEMARELVWGAVRHAQGLGFEAHPDFERTWEHLGAWEPTGVVRFGCDGKPLFRQGARDDGRRIIRTLQRSVGDGNFHFLVNA